MSDLDILADITIENANTTPLVIDLIYKRKVYEMMLPPNLVEFLNSNVDGYWKYTYELLNEMQSIKQMSNLQEKKELLLNILQDAIRTDNYIPLAIAKMLRIELPYDLVTEQMAKSFRNGNRNVMFYIAENGLVSFTSVLAKYAAKSNNVRFLADVISLISEPLDLNELRSLAVEYSAYDNVAYLDSLINS